MTAKIQFVFNGCYLKKSEVVMAHTFFLYVNILKCFPIYICYVLIFAKCCFKIDPGKSTILHFTYVGMLAHPSISSYLRVPFFAIIMRESIILNSHAMVKRFVGKVIAWETPNKCVINLSVLQMYGRILKLNDSKHVKPDTLIVVNQTIEKGCCVLSSLW